MFSRREGYIRYVSLVRYVKADTRKMNKKSFTNKTTRKGIEASAKK
jgi:hypothetical protein